MVLVHCDDRLVDRAAGELRPSKVLFSVLGVKSYFQGRALITR